MDQYKQNMIVIGSIVILLALNMGVIEWCGIPMAYIKFICEILAFTVFILSLSSTSTNRLAKLYATAFVVPLAACGISGFIVAVDTPDGAKGGVLFTRWIISYSLFGAAFLMVPPTKKEIRRTVILVAGLLLFQPLVATIKLIALGVGESPWIGTLHQSAGQFGLLLPLIALSFLLPFFLVRNSFISVLLIFPFVFFSIVYEKRAALYLLPTWTLIVYSLYATMKLWLKRVAPQVVPNARHEFGKIAAVLCVVFISFFSTIKYSPSLNPQEKVGGTISFEHVTSYTVDYLSRDYDHKMNFSEMDDVKKNNDIQIGRFSAILKIWKFMADQEFKTFFFGFGGGYVNPSHILGDARVDILYDRTGIRSSIPAAMNLLIEAGLFGFLLLIIWFCGIGGVLVTILWSSITAESFLDALSVFGLFGVIAFDFFVYSSVIWTAGVLSPLLFAILGCKIGRWCQNTSLRNDMGSPHISKNTLIEQL